MTPAEIDSLILSLQNQKAEWIQAHKDEFVIEDSRPVEPVELDTILSVRMDGQTLEWLQERAEFFGLSKSALIRHIVREELTRPMLKMVNFG